VASAWSEPIKIAEQPKPIEKPSSAPGAQQDKSNGRLPPSLSDLVSSFETIKKKTQDVDYISHMLDSSLQFVPDLTDSER
jgi:CCR4-NOT transcription complex subunit 3